MLTEGPTLELSTLAILLTVGVINQLIELGVPPAMITGIGIAAVVGLAYLVYLVGRRVFRK
jgi:predicted acylesterase/phospholipase RssA